MLASADDLAPLPAELAFLADHGVVPGRLTLVALEARRLGADPVEIGRAHV